MKIRNALLGVVIILFVASIVGVLPSTETVGFFGFSDGGMSFDPSGPPAAQNEEESCVDNCVNEKCVAFNKESGAEGITQAEMQENIAKFSECMLANQAACDEECGMVQGPAIEDMDEEQVCITKCVATHDPDMICGNSQTGETGGTVCQMCAQQCVHLYSGPCLNDEQITEKESVCYAQCEHCYGEPIEGPSGQGWDCIVDIQCGDASSEFGDDPGSGPASYEKGHGPGEEFGSDDSAVLADSDGGSLVDAISDFFSNLF